MLSKNKIRLINSLDSKKIRSENGLFVAEGEKLVSEIIESQLTIKYLAGTEDWFSKTDSRKLNSIEKDIVSNEQLKKISFLKTPQSVLCLAKIPTYDLNLASLKDKLLLVLDNVQDPGNLGTIIRIADWFGIEHIICSVNSADAFNPKVVQATMGAICRVKIYYEDLAEILKTSQRLNIPMFGTTLNGENIYNADLKPNGLIMMGNESKGISPACIPYLTQQLFIPFYPPEQQQSESLNVAIATAIVCSEFRRRM